MDSKRILPIALIGVAVVALVVYAAFFGSGEQPTPTANQAVTSNPTTAASQMPQAPTETTIPDKPVSSKDPATLVPEGTDLKQYCEKYYSAWQKGDWQTAYDLQPLSKKKDKTLDDFSQSLQGYGMTSYVVGDPKISGNSGTVGVNLDLGQNGIWKTNWTFVKNDKGQWTVFNSITSPIQ